MSHFLTFLAGWWFCTWGTCICYTGPRPILAHCTWEAICGACEGYWRNEIIQGIWQTPSWADEHASCWCQAEESSRGWEGRQEVIGLITSRAPFIFLDVDESIHFWFEPFILWTWVLIIQVLWILWFAWICWSLFGIGFGSFVRISIFWSSAAIAL